MHHDNNLGYCETDTVDSYNASKCESENDWKGNLKANMSYGLISEYQKVNRNLIDATTKKNCKIDHRTILVSKERELLSSDLNYDYYLRLTAFIFSQTCYT